MVEGENEGRYINLESYKGMDREIEMEGDRYINGDRDMEEVH